MASNWIGAGMSILGNLFGSLSHSNASTQLNRRDTAWMYDQQSQHWKANTQWFNENGYTMLRKGLEDAGYNPLMALGATPQSGATVQGSAMDTKSKSWSLDLPMSMAQSLANVKNTHADTLLKNAQVDETISRSNLENAEAILKNTEIPYADRKNAAELIGIEIDNRKKEAEIKQIEADTGLKLSQKELTEVQGAYYVAMTMLSYQQAQYFSSMIQRIENGLTLTSDQAEWMKKHPKQAQVLQYVRRYGDAFHTIIKGVDINRYDNTYVNF